MDLKIFFSVVLGTVLLVLLASPVTSQEGEGGGGGGGGGGGHGGESKLTCKGQPLNLDTSVLKACMTATPPPLSRKKRESKKKKGKKGDKKKKGDKDKKGKGEKKAKAGTVCTQVCVMQKQKILDDTGKYHTEGAHEHLDQYYPAVAKEELKIVYDDCATQHGASFSMVYDCAGYVNFIQCAIKGLKENCG